MKDIPFSPTLGMHLLDINQVAQILGISKDTLYKMVNQRRIPFLKVGRLLRFDQPTLAQWLQQHSIRPNPSRKP